MVVRREIYVDRRRLSHTGSRPEVVLLLNIDSIKNSGFHPGEDINVIYGHDRITILKDNKMREVVEAIDEAMSIVG
jgi:hypothetical protein